MRDREKLGARTRILHAVRTYVDGPAGSSPFMRRRGGRGWAHQGFDWPKASWGGQLKARLEKLQGEERRQLWELMGGSTTPIRRGWQRELARGREQGYYSTFGGELDHVDPGPEGGLTAYFKPGAAVSAGPVGVDFIIDATGLVGSVTEHRALSDLLAHSGADRNVLGRIDVAPTFEVRAPAPRAGGCTRSERPWRAPTTRSSTPCWACGTGHSGSATTSRPRATAGASVRADRSPSGGSG
ncbi:hypothetical protein BJF83_11535 [Nocardiopsis sp. CNR-923]|uniref:hypothetical protein n=1 Tax=Nocardiopsis sp. CNR-923 TaxID=1904965 RepID=UPI0009621914|nr:hypothetical protein [Nocardiopsis sp. CNR-923]OLT29373.1 hypothetical protein BJF83_11535 [Nocardiopsis sp. CNR-923]